VTFLSAPPAARERIMKFIFLAATAMLTGSVILATTAHAAGCVTGRYGRTVCETAAGAVVAPAAVVVAPKAVVVAPAPVVVAPRAVIAAPVSTATRHPSGVTTATGVYGDKAAYNPNTGKAAVQTTNPYNGVKTTQTNTGVTAKSKNGYGVAQGPGGKTCVKGHGNAGCN
jgi:hypothetical protein